MDKKIVKILIAIIAIIIIMISIVTIILLKNKNDEMQDDSGIMGEDIDENTYQISKTDSVIEFEIVRNLIQCYINYYEMNNTDAIKEIANEEIKFTINKYENIKFFIDEMYGMSLYSGARYFIKGEISTDLNNYYIRLDLDFNNNTYKLQEINMDEYNTEINTEHNESNTKYNSIEKGQYNKYREVGIDETYSLIDGYVEQYKSYIKRDLKKAYEILDDEYKEKKFNNSYDKFVLYIDGIKDEIELKTLDGYSKNEEEVSTEYEANLDGEDVWVFRSSELGKYTILLDNYTIKTQDFIDKYNELSATNKVGTNIDKIFKMLNNKEYEQIYDCLSDAYKANNFETYTKFENYIKEKFFNYNYIGETKVQEEQQYYVANVKYSNGNGSAAEYRKISIIMRLDDDAEFTIAFANEE